MKKIAGFLAVASLGLAGSAPAQAEEDVALPYDVPLKCAALSTFFAASEAEDGDPEQEAFHNEQGQRFLFMAMVRDGADGEVAGAEFEPLIGRLFDKIESYGDDVDALEGFLIEGATACAELRDVFQEEFDAIELEEKAEAEAG